MREDELKDVLLFHFEGMISTNICFPMVFMKADKEQILFQKHRKLTAGFAVSEVVQAWDRAAKLFIRYRSLRSIVVYYCPLAWSNPWANPYRKYRQKPGFGLRFANFKAYPTITPSSKGAHSIQLVKFYCSLIFSAIGPNN